MVFEQHLEDEREFLILWLQLKEDVRLAGVPRQALVNF